jgi:hypothetical protein
MGHRLPNCDFVSRRTPDWTYIRTASPQSTSASHQFSFISTGTQYVGKTVSANAGYAAAWIIEGVTYPGLNPGTVALSGSKTIYFDITPQNSLTAFFCSGNSLSGNIPSLGSFTSLASFQCNSNVLNGADAGFSVGAALHAAYLQNNLLPQAAVDSILAAFVAAGASGAYALNIGGTGNASPSAAGLADKATLAGRGWTVTTN